MLTKRLMKNFEKYCSDNKIEGKKKEEMMEKLKKYIKKMSYEPGEAIGVVAAQSISEPATQMTMRSYTMATQSDRLSKVTQGLPRLVELFDVRKTFERNMLIYLKEKYNSREEAKKVALKIKNYNIRDIIVSGSIDIIDFKIELKAENSEDVNEIKELISKKIKNIEVKIRGDVLSVETDETDIQKLKKMRKKILDYHVRGVKNINDVIVVKEKNDWIIQTTGANLKEILKIPEVDISRTKTNDIHQVYEVLGIEAAREVLIQESKETLDEQGLDMDIRHIMLLADMMTSDGKIEAIGRYGVSGSKSSVLARANFEETKKHVVNASFYGESDNLKGIIENVMIGQVAPVGTGIVNLAVDTEKMQKMIKK